MPKKSGITWQLTFFTLGFRWRGKRGGDTTDAWSPAFVWQEWWFCVTGVVLLCIGSNALKCREQCFDETI